MEESRDRSYLIIGGARAGALCMARAMVMKAVAQWSAAADVLALSSVEVTLSNIAPGATAIVKWRGKPVFIRHRTEAEISTAESDDGSPALRDPELDSTRRSKPEWLIVIGICTHLGCVPFANAGNYGGWFCPCHGSHYDLSGRIREGPAPRNLEVPEYSFVSDNIVKIG